MAAYCKNTLYVYTGCYINRILWPYFRYVVYEPKQRETLIIYYTCQQMHTHTHTQTRGKYENIKLYYKSSYIFRCFYTIFREF